jgi:hypothetical protein
MLSSLNNDNPSRATMRFDAGKQTISSLWNKFFFSEKPKLYIDAVWKWLGFSMPVVMIFKHATVILSDRGKFYHRPLGLSGKAIQMVTTCEYIAKGQDSTTVKVSVHGAGEIEEGIPAKIESVWHHFLFERLKPYIEGGMKMK